MKTSKVTARIVGVLYIIGTVAGVFSVLVTQPLLGSPDYLAQIAAQENRMVTGALLVLTMGFALAMIPALLFPILKKVSEPLALGYVIFRGALETTAYFATVICWLLLIVISRENAAAGAANMPYYQALGSVLFKGGDAITNIVVIVFSLDAIMLYYFLYVSRLVPRWISVWGFIAIGLHFSTAFITLYHLLSPEAAAYLDIINLPIFLQEMVMAVWLIVKGFSQPAAAPEIARPVVIPGSI